MDAIFRGAKKRSNLFVGSSLPLYFLVAFSLRRGERKRQRQFDECFKLYFGTCRSSLVGRERERSPFCVTLRAVKGKRDLSINQRRITTYCTTTVHAVDNTKQQTSFHRTQSLPGDVTERKKSTPFCASASFLVLCCCLSRRRRRLLLLLYPLRNELRVDPVVLYVAFF